MSENISPYNIKSEILESFYQFLKDRRNRIIFALIFFLGLLVYAPSFLAPFYYDDYSVIVDNYFIKQPSLKALFRYDPSRFLTNTTFQINYFLNGLNVWGWHAVNFGLHVANTFLAYHLVLLTFQTKRLRGRWPDREQKIISLSVAFMFLLHPIQTQSVVYLVQRATLLSALFYLLIMYFFIKAQLAEKKRYYVWIALLVFLSMFTKPILVTLPFAIMLYQWCFFGFERKTNLKKVFIFTILTLPVVIIPLILLGAAKLTSLAQEGYRVAPYSSHIFTKITILPTYLRLFIFPIEQNFDYDYKIVDTLFDLRILVILLFLVLMTIWALRIFKREPLVTFGFFWVFITLGPQASIFPLADLIYEHWLYLPCLGFSIIMGVCLNKLFQKRNTFITIMSLILTFLGVLTYQRNLLWKDPIMLMEDTARKSPQKARVYNNLGLILFEKGILDKAEKAYKKAIFLDSQYFITYSNLALLYFKENQFAAAENILIRLIQQHPEFADAYTNLAQLYEKKGEYKKAYPYYLKAKEMSPYDSSINIGLGNIYQDNGYLPLATEAYKEAIKLRPESAIAHYSLGNIYFKNKQLYDAMLEYEKAVALQPNLPQAYNNLGNIYFYFRDYKGAINYYTKAIFYDPHLPEAYFNLANSYLENGQGLESKKFIEKAIELYKAKGYEEKAQEISDRLKYNEKFSGR